MAIYDTLNEPGAFTWSLGAATRGVGGPGAGDRGAAKDFVSAAQRIGLQESLAPIAAQTGQTLLPGGFLIGDSYQQQQIDQSQRAWEQQQRNRSQVLDILGAKQLGAQGGLLGQNFFQSLLGNTPGGLVGDVAGGLAGSGLFSGGGGGGQLSQHGFPDAPSSGGGLFGELIGSRRREGGQILQDLANFGGSRRSAINQDFANQAGTAQGMLESRGLGATDLVTAAQSRVDRNRQQALGELEDQLIGQRVGARMQLGEGLFGDVGDELNRNVERQRMATGLIGGLLGNALNVVNI